MLDNNLSETVEQENDVRFTRKDYDATQHEECIQILLNKGNLNPKPSVNNLTLGSQ